jgi:hypothetical protein
MRSRSGKSQRYIINSLVNAAANRDTDTAERLAKKLQATRAQFPDTSKKQTIPTTSN